MLNFLKSKVLKETKLYYLKTKLNFVKENRHYPPAIQEWSNSIYKYNKSNLKNILSLDNYLLRLIKAIYNLKSKYYKKKLKIKKFRKWERFTYNNNKILLSNPEIKHRNDNMIVNLYLYNRDKLHYLSLLKKLSLNKYRNNYYNNYLSLNNYYINNNKKKYTKLFVIKKINSFNKLKFYLSKKMDKLNTIFIKSSKKDIKINYLIILKKYLKFKENLKKLLWKNYLINLKRKNIIIKFNNYITFNKKFNKYCLKFEKILFQKEMITIILKKSLLIDKFKTHEILLLPLRKIFFDIYNKSIIFNLVNLKRPLFNNSLLGRLIVSKINNRKLNAKRAAKGVLLKIKPVYDQRLDYFKEKLAEKIVQKVKFNQKIINFKKDIITNYLKKKFIFFKENSSSNNQYNILSDLKNKNICGIRLELNGRLTRKIIAERAIKRIYYVGHIKNTDSSYRGVSNVVLRGKLRSNLDYYKISSKTRIGAYGLKSWVNLR